MIEYLTKASLAARPDGISTTSPSPYPLHTLLTALARLDSLASLVSTLRSQILTHVITPLARPKSAHQIVIEDSRIQVHPSAAPRSMQDSLNDIAEVLNFVQTHFVSKSSTLSENKAFTDGLRKDSYQLALDQLIIPSLPTRVDDLPIYLNVVLAASERSEDVIKPFYDAQVGEAWGNKRRRAVGEDVRRLIVKDGWRGWEGQLVQREKDVVEIVEEEVEVDGEEEHVNGVDSVVGNGSKSEKPVDHDNVEKDQEKEDVVMGNEQEEGWGFEEKREEALNSQSLREVDEGEGWGFDEAQPAKPPTTTAPVDDVVEEGWAFDDDPTPPAPVEKPPPPPPKPAKPAREAKRLAKKVGKAKIQDDFEWGSESEATQSSLPSPPLPQPPRRTPTPPPAQPMSSVISSAEKADDGWGWDEEEAKPTPVKRQRRRIKVLKEQKRRVSEQYLISKACQDLLDMAQDMLREVVQLENQYVT